MGVYVNSFVNSQFKAKKYCKNLEKQVITELLCLFF